LPQPGDRKKLMSEDVYSSMGINGRTAGDSNEMRPLIAGTIGLGPTADRLLEALSPTGIEVKWLCDTNPQLLERTGRCWPSCARTTDAELLFEDVELDVLFLTPTAAGQLAPVSRALEAGKHTFLSDPVRLSAAALTELARLERRQGVVFSCGNTNLHSPPVRAVTKLLGDRRIGELFFVSSTCTDARSDRSGAAAIEDLGREHFARLLHWVGERPRTVRAVAPDVATSDAEDLTVLTIAFPSGVVVNAELGGRDNTALNRTVLVGGERMAVYDESEADTVSTLDHGVVHRPDEDATDYRVSYPIADVVIATPIRQEPLERALGEFEQAIRHDRGTISSGRLARDAMRVIEAAQDSLRRGGAEVSAQGSRRLLRTQSKRRLEIG
jgi:predicted dehydrogenase